MDTSSVHRVIKFYNNISTLLTLYVKKLLITAQKVLCRGSSVPVPVANPGSEPTV